MDRSKTAASTSERPADNPEKLAEFYEKLFQWKFDKTPGPMEYWLIHTAPEGQGVGGGLMKRQVPQQQILVYFQVESVDDYAAKCKAMGGAVVVEKRPVPGMGWFAVCLDPQHNAFALWQMDQSAA